MPRQSTRKNPLPTWSDPRTFDQRLREFGAQLGPFLREVWKQRLSINLNDAVAGPGKIYNLYAGSQTDDFTYNRDELERFLKGLVRIAGAYGVRPQTPEMRQYFVPFENVSDAVLKSHGQYLWDEFFHVSPRLRRYELVRSRVYLHTNGGHSSLEMMNRIVRQMGINEGLVSAKTVGPGSRRFDTIVCYLIGPNSAESLVKVLRKNSRGLLRPELPPLVKPVAGARGIGRADEPPRLAIRDQPGQEANTRWSFGSFYSELIWMALRNTPGVRSDNADGRPMLDNMLYSLRLLGVDPKSPQGFPKAAALEQLYRDHANDGFCGPSPERDSSKAGSSG
jgi:hypothetical protein